MNEKYSTFHAFKIDTTFEVSNKNHFFPVIYSLIQPKITFY